MSKFESAKEAISLIDETSIRIQMYAHEPISRIGTTATFEDDRELELSKEEAQFLVQQHLNEDEEIQSLLTGHDLFEDVHPQAFNLEERIEELETELSEYLPEDYSYSFEHIALNMYQKAWSDLIRGILKGEISKDDFEACTSFFEEGNYDDDSISITEYIEDYEGE